MINDLKYSCEEIAGAVNGRLEGKNREICAVSINSREKSDKPFCFFALKGKKHNGAEYIDEAISNGAVLIVTEEKIDCPVSVIYVENAIKALGLLAKSHKGKTRVIGVTGSNGKTTVKDMIISVLKEKYSVTGTVSNNNNEIGVPLTLLSIKNEDFCVIEMGMRARGEIEWLSYISQPELSVITNCGSAHIGRLGGKEEIFNAKAEILKYTEKYAVLPSENRFKSINNEKLKRIYVGKNGDWNAENISLNIKTLCFDINSCNFEIESIYRHNATNASFAYAVGQVYGVEEGLIKEGLKKWRAKESRGEILTLNGIEIINDCYNASYESVKSAIASLAGYAERGKKTAVLLGDMLELGNKAESLHFRIGQLCKELSIDKMLVYGRYSKNYISGYGGGIEFENTEEIAKRVFCELDSNYVLLIKASNAMNFEKIIENMREMQDDKR